MRWFIFLFMFILGCTNMNLNIENSELILKNPILLNVQQVKVIDKSPLEMPQYGGFADHESALVEPLQSQFKNAITNLFIINILPSKVDLQNKAIVRIDRAAITMINSGIKEVPFLDIIFLSLGSKETYKAYINGVIEIEDSKGYVINKADINIIETVKEKCGTNEEIERGSNQVAKQALFQLKKELHNITNRYLYEHLSLQKANEGAARENIKQGIIELSKIKIGAG